MQTLKIATMMLLPAPLVQLVQEADQLPWSHGDTCKDEGTQVWEYFDGTFALF